MNGSIEYQLGEIRAELRSISQRLDEGSERHSDFDSRLDKLELIEAKRGGVIAAIAALAGIVGAVLSLTVPTIIKKFF